MKKVFLDRYKEIMKKALSIGASISLILTMLSLGQQNLVIKFIDSTSSEATLVPSGSRKTPYR